MSGTFTPAEADTASPERRQTWSFVRHELRMPLNQILGYSEMLIEDAADQGREALCADLTKIHAAARRLLTLLDGLCEMPATAFHPVGGSPPPALAPASGAAASSRHQAEVSEAASLLVVDDNEMNRDLLSRRLERQGHTVTCAEDGRRALEILREEAFDLVLLDIMMPEMDGYQVLSEMKADSSLRHIPVIMISALDQIESVIHCIQLGAEDYLPKPFNPVLLRARLGASLEKKRSRDRELQLYQDLRENYIRLQELERQRDELTHMIIHDLRTPLTSLLTGLQSACLLGDLNDIQQECFDMAISGGRTLLEMINDLLDISKMEAGSLRLEPREIRPTDLVADALGQVTALAAAGGLTLRSDVPVLVPISADEEKLRRTLVNLLSNALKFTPSGGTVTVSCRPQEDPSGIVFAVEDTGEGIPPDAFQRIFEKFGQVETRQAGRKMSTGLGLTFCKMVVEAHGGRIWVESQPGCGSTFRFTIPR